MVGLLRHVPPLQVHLDTYYPLYGVTADAGQINAALNSSLAHAGEPRGVGLHLDAHRLPDGECHVLRGKRREQRALRQLDEQQLPLHAQRLVGADADWSFSAGVAEMDSWINQNVNLSNLSATPGGYGPRALAVYRRGRRAQSRHPLSGHGKTVVYGHVRVRAGHEFQFGRRQPDRIKWAESCLDLIPPPRPTTSASTRWSRCSPSASNVGADYRFGPRVTSYVRYNYYDYEDESGHTSGQANMVLGGMSAKF